VVAGAAGDEDEAAAALDLGDVVLDATLLKLDKWLEAQENVNFKFRIGFRFKPRKNIIFF